jgi:hypothetical protein
MFRRSIGEKLTSTISIAWYFTTKSGGIWKMSPGGTTGNREEGNTMATQAECVKVIQTETERLRQYLAGHCQVVAPPPQPMT